MRRYLFLISQPAAAMTLACGPLLHLIHQVVIRLSCHWATSHAMIVLAVAPARHAFAPLCSLRPADHDVHNPTNVLGPSPPDARTQAALSWNQHIVVPCAGAACPTIERLHPRGPSLLLGPWSLAIRSILSWLGPASWAERRRLLIGHPTVMA